MKAYAWAVSDMRAVEAYEQAQDLERQKAASPGRGRKR